MSLIYKNPIKVICTNAKHSVKLIEGATYSASSLNHNNKGKFIYISNVGRYNIKYFKNIDGTPLDNLPEFNCETKIKYLDIKNNNYTGQYVKCRYSSSKSLIVNEIYYVEQQKTIERLGFNKKVYYDTKFKIRGIRNLVSPYRFQEISLIDQRNLKINNLTGNKIQTGENKRKFLQYSEKTKIAILFETLAKIVSDLKNTEIKNTNIDFVKLMVIKGKKHGLIEDDVRDFLSLNLSTILNKFT